MKKIEWAIFEIPFRSHVVDLNLQLMGLNPLILHWTPEARSSLESRWQLLSLDFLLQLILNEPSDRDESWRGNTLKYDDSNKLQIILIEIDLCLKNDLRYFLISVSQLKENI